ncbi:3'-5' exonuclease, partial [Gordonia paraffinivorans]|uniref:3'-5' exonuclease n=1 Tax=Gordonia paraffinivorans TaxID=175628 RepID=UPI0024330E2F
KKELALELPGPVIGDLPAQRRDGYVLLTTYNKTLARQMERNVDLLVDDPEIRRRIRVRTVDSFARSVFEHYHGTLASDRFMARPANLWQKIANELELDFTGRFLHEEHVEVILAQTITSEEEYLRARRSGRGKPIGASQRKTIWRAVTRFNELMATRGWWTFETILHEAARVMPEIAQKDPGYRYIIVDEAQDLTPDHWRLLAAAMSDQTNGLFISGDAQQTIYRRQTSMRSFGINVVGRSTRLHKNHRVSAEILRWAHDFLRAVGDESPPESDSEGEIADEGAPDTASFSGFVPVTRGFDDSSEELDYVVETIRGWTEDMGYSADEIGVLARSHEQVKTVREVLKDRGIACRALDDLRRRGVAVGTMHSAKGLEFRCVVVVGVSEDQVPPAGSVTPKTDDAVTHRADMERERKLLFVACTRAREDLLVTWTGQPSLFMKPGI